MLALVLDESLALRRDHPRPSRAPGEALIAMRLAGVCDTDLALSRGYMGYRGVLGHEFVGQVLECDDARWLGRRVVGDINAGCGQCTDCLERGGHHCATRSVLGILRRDGAMAEQLCLPERCLVAVPDGVSDEHAVFSEPLAAALHVADVLEPGAPALVLGDGKLGLLVAAALAAAQVDVTLVGHHRDKLSWAQARGVRTLLEGEATGLSPVSQVIEATGNPAGVELALKLLAPRGRLILKTTVADKSRLDLSPIVINELTVIGSRCGNLQHAIDRLEAGFDPRGLVSARYPLAEAERALEHAGRKGTLKVLIKGVE